jgi:hypothetical protein
VPRLPALAPAGAWGERIVVAVVAVLGIGLLRAAGRGS